MDKNWPEEEALQYLLNNQTDVDENVFFVSAVKKWGLTALLTRISQVLSVKTTFQAQY
jgi:50S ribosomal subunit-associated GTPase HflX